MLPLALALFAWLALRPGREPWTWPALSGAFALGLSCKLGPALALGALLTAWPAARGRWAGGGAVRARVGRGGAAGRRAGRGADSRRIGGACLAGSGVAAGAWLLLALLHHLPPERPLEDLSTALTQVLSGVPLHLAYLVGAIRSAQWLHPLVVALLVAVPLGLSRAGPGAALLFAGGALALLSLGKLAAGYPKYVAGPWPLLAAAAGAALATWLSRGQRPYPLVAAGVLAGAGLTALAGADALIRGAELQLLALWLAAGAGLLALAAPLGPARPAALVLGLIVGAGLATSAVSGRSAPAPRPTSTGPGGRWRPDAGWRTPCTPRRRSGALPARRPSRWPTVRWPTTPWASGLGRCTSWTPSAGWTPAPGARRERRGRRRSRRCA